jgi:hypothetical protein
VIIYRTEKFSAGAGIAWTLQCRLSYPSCYRASCEYASCYPLHP